METKFDLKSARVRANLTQREMARKMGMSQTSYLRYEKGELVLRVDQAWNFSKIVGITFDQIIFLSQTTLQVYKSKPHRKSPTSKSWVSGKEVR